MRNNLVFVGIVVGVLALGAGLAWAMFAAAHSPSSANRNAHATSATPTTPTTPTTSATPATPTTSATPATPVPVSQP